MISQETLKKYLHYDPFTGIFTCLIETAGRRTGEQVGYKTKRGYIRIALLGEHYEAGRLAFLYMTGEFPAGLIDHKDQVTDNNIWENLRESSVAENGHNRKAQANNKLGIKGVSLCKQTGKFVAEICTNGKRLRLGRFLTKELAENAVISAREKAHKEFTCHG